MNDIQVMILELENKGWTLAALSDEIKQSTSTVEKWKSGQRYPGNEKAVKLLFNDVAKKKRIPKKKRYKKPRSHLTKNI